MTANIANYRMTHDYHSHTIYSDGKATPEESVLAAREKGLKGIGITEHGPGHLTYGIKRENIPVLRAEIERLRQVYDDIEIYMGVEANIINKDNHLDLKHEEFALFDYVMGGYHYGVLNGYCVGNFLNRHTTETLRYNTLLVKNTDMAVKAIYENNLKILTHPGDKGPFDIDAIAKACEDTGTWMEISAWHGHPTVEEIRTASKYDVAFVLNSDAHSTDRIADFGKGLMRALSAGLDLARIVNMEKE